VRRFFISLLIGVISILLCYEAPSAWALTSSQRKIIDSGVYYTNEEGCLPTNTGATSVNTNQAEEYTFWTLVSKGLTMQQAAGVLGNMWAESSVNPRRVQGTKTPEGDSDTPVGSKGYGLVQWTPGTKILTDAQKAQKSPGDLAFQVNLLWDQLEGRSAIPEKAAGDDLKKQTTVRDATISFLVKFERAGKPNTEERVRFAERVYQNFSGRTPPAGITVAQNSAASPGCGPGSLAGSASSINGFVIYSQFDPAWKNKPYGSSTIGESGCGPSAIAMIVSTFSGSRVTPDMVAARFGTYYIPGQGSNWSLMIDGPEAYGFKSTDIGTDMSRAAAELRSGSVVIASGTGPKPFTAGGHILVLRGITAEGKLLVGDSGNSDTSDKEWDAALLAGYIRNMWVVKK
jgi:hypothetical protein